MADQKLNIRIAAIDKTQKAFATVKRGLSAVTKAMFSFKASIVAAVGIGGLGLLVKKSLDGIDRISKLSRTLGIATNDLRKLELAAGLSGVELETLARGVRTLNAGMFDFVEKGTGTAVDAFGALGISAEELQQLGLSQQMEVVADAMSEVENQSDRVRLAMKLFDSEGVALVNTLGGGSDALREMTTELDNMGLSINRVDAKAVEDANDAILRASAAAGGLSQKFTVELAPSIEATAEAMQGLTDNLETI